MFDSLNFEAFDLEFAEMQELLELSVKDTVEGEARELASQELNDLADALELAFGESEEELIENLRMTADNNPLSETAIDLTIEAMEIL